MQLQEVVVDGSALDLLEANMTCCKLNTTIKSAAVVWIQAASPKLRHQGLHCISFNNCLSKTGAYHNNQGTEHV